MINTSKESLLLAIMVIAVAIGPSWTTGAQTIGGPSREIDFLKIRTVQDRDTFLALNKAADAYGLKLVGHVTGIPPEVVLAGGQDGVEHAFYPSLDGKTQEERLAIWRKFAEQGVAVVPTLVTLFEATFPPTDRLRAIVEDENARLDCRAPDRRMDDWGRTSPARNCN